MNSFLTNCQHGFHQNVSRTTQLIQFSHDVAVELNINFQVAAIFIGYAEVFDKGCHTKLVLKVEQILRECNWIIVYLFERQQFVSYNS